MGASYFEVEHSHTRPDRLAEFPPARRLPPRGPRVGTRGGTFENTRWPHRNGRVKFLA
jgi:hypothetical protein